MWYSTGDLYNLRIDIDLEPGIYVFEPESATGKTYLGRIMNEYRQYGEPLLAIDPGNYKYLDIESIIEDGCKVIMVDRYDMYKGSLMEVFEGLSDKTVILIDCKSQMPCKLKVGVAYIRYALGIIEVH